MIRVRRRQGVFQTLIALKIASGDEVLGIPYAAAEIKAWADSPPAAAIEIKPAAGLELFFGGHINDACGAKAVLRRQNPVEQNQAVDKFRFQHRPQRRHAVRQLHAIEAVLNVGVLVAHVEVGVADRRIGGHARCLQQNLVEAGVLALRQGV